MFGIGMPEMLMILVVALMVVGPKRLPEMAHTIGKALAKVRAVGNSVQQEFDKEMRPMRDLNPLSDDHRIHPEPTEPRSAEPPVAPPPPNDAAPETPPESASQPKHD